MTEILDMQAGRIVMRRPDGTTILDSAARMPAELGRFEIADVIVDWPVASGEGNTYLPVQGKWRHEVPAHVRTEQQILAPYPPGLPLPQIVWSRLRFVRTLQGRCGFYVPRSETPSNAWSWLMGSQRIESKDLLLVRVVNLAVVGGNWVLEKRQASAGFSIDDTQQNSTRSTFTFSAKIAWGIFDA